MRILSVRLEHLYSFSSDDDDRKEAQRLRRVERAEKLSKLGIHLSPKRGEENDYEDAPTISVTEHQYIDLIQNKIAGDVQSVTEAGSGLDPRGAIAHVERLIDKVESFAKDITNLQYNEKVEVYTPGMALMLFNRVMLLEDACSDALQTELDNGWKIIAACPQPNQRRPDYILGRYDPTHADNSGAGNAALRG